MLDKYAQNARMVRTPSSSSEVSNLFQSIQNSINNPSLCTSAIVIGNYPFTPVETGQQSTLQSFPVSLVATVGSTSVPIATPGMISNQVSIATAAQTQASGLGDPIQITAGPNYTNFGTQPSPGPSSFQNLNCSQANLHVVVSKEIPASTGTNNGTQMPSNSQQVKRRTMGSLFEEHDFPIALLTDPTTNLIKGCFGGVATNICAQAAAPTLTSFVVNTLAGCIDLNPAHTGAISWVTTGAVSGVLTCGSGPTPWHFVQPLTAAQIAAGTYTITSGMVGDGTNLSCQLTVTNSADVSTSQTSPTTFISAVTCPPPNVIVYTSTSCVNTGAPFTLWWTDADDDPAALVNATGTDGYSNLGASTNPAPLPMTAPASVPGPGSITYTVLDIPTGQSNSKSVTVMASPVPPTLTMTSPASRTYSTTSVPASGTVGFSWPATTGVTSVILSGTDGSTVTSTGTTATLPAPTASGTYNYTLMANGGCAGTPPVAATNNGSVQLVVTSPSSSPSPSPSTCPCNPPGPTAVWALSPDGTIATTQYPDTCNNPNACTASDTALCYFSGGTTDGGGGYPNFYLAPNGHSGVQTTSMPWSQQSSCNSLNCSTNYYAGNQWDGPDPSIGCTATWQYSF